MHAVSVSSGQTTDFTTVDMHAVSGNAARSEDSIGFQALGNTLPIACQAVVFI